MIHKNMIWKSAKGSFVYDISGHAYLDLGAGIVCANLGHAPKALLTGISKALSESLLFAYRNEYLERNKLEMELLIAAGRSFKKFAFATTGAETIEIALRIAGRRSTSGLKKIVAFSGAFHGKTLGAAILTDVSRYRSFAEVYSPTWLLRLPYPGARGAWPQLKQKLESEKESIIAIFLELVQGSTLDSIDRDTAVSLSKWCRKNNVLLVIDEIQTGFCRLGDLFGFQQYGLDPDLVCLAKGLANGLPLAGLLVGKRASQFYSETLDSSTYMANPLAVYAARWILRKFNSPSLKKQLLKSEQFFAFEMNRLRRFSIDRIQIKHNRGMLAGIVFLQGSKAAKRFVQGCLDAGVLVIGPIGERENLVKIAPSLVISAVHLKKGFTVLRNQLARMTSNI